MENKIKMISKKLLKYIDEEKEKLFIMDPKSKYEASVILDFLNELDKQSVLLNMLIEESDDEEYIKENKSDIYNFFKNVKDYCVSIPEY
jgi:hypothetical protein